MRPNQQTGDLRGLNHFRFGKETNSLKKNERDFMEGSITLPKFLRISRNLTEPDVNMIINFIHVYGNYRLFNICFTEWVRILMTLPIIVMPIKNNRRFDIGADFWLNQSGQFNFLLLPRFGECNQGEMDENRITKVSKSMPLHLVKWSLYPDIYTSYWN